MKNPLKFSKGLKKYNAGIELTDIFIAILIAAVLTIAILMVFEKTCVKKMKQTILENKIIKRSAQTETLKRQW